MHAHQSSEFAIRAQVLPAQEILMSATSVHAEILQRGEELGRVAPEALADLIVIDGDPLQDIELLDGQGEHIPLVMKGGEIFTIAL